MATRRSTAYGGTQTRSCPRNSLEAIDLLCGWTLPDISREFYEGNWKCAKVGRRILGWSRVEGLNPENEERCLLRPNSTIECSVSQLLICSWQETVLLTSVAVSFNRADVLLDEANEGFYYALGLWLELVVLFLLIDESSRVFYFYYDNHLSAPTENHLYLMQPMYLPPEPLGLKHSVFFSKIFTRILLLRVQTIRGHVWWGGWGSFSNYYHLILFIYVAHSARSLFSS